MPQIPEFTAPAPFGELPIERDTATANPQALAAPGLATEHLGNAVAGIGEAFGKLQEFKDFQYVADNLADATTKAHDALNTGMESARQAGGDAGGFAKNLRGSLDQDLQGRIDNAPSAMAGARLKRHFATLTDTINGHAVLFEHAMGVQDAQASRLQDVEQTQLRVQRNPSLAPAEWGRVAGSIAGAGQAGLFNADTVAKLTQSASNGIWSAEALGRAEHDPAGVLADIKSGRYDDHIDFKTQQALQPHLMNTAARAIAGQLPTTAAVTSGGGGVPGGHVNYGSTGALGNPADPGWAAANITTVNSPSGAPFQVHKAAAADFSGFLKDLEDAGYKIDPAQSGGYNFRNMRGGLQLSEHTYADAIDINSQRNPYSAGGQRTTDLPANVAEIAAKHNLEWGGDWKTPNDPMHFQWRGPGDRAPSGQVAGPGAPPTASTPGGGLAGLFDRIDKMGLDPDLAAKVKVNAQVNYAALEADQARQQRMQEKAATERTHAAEDHVIADAYSANPQITAQQVANDPAFADHPEQRLRMIGVVRGVGEAGPAAGPSHMATLDLVKRINLPDGDPQKITDRAPILDALGNNIITKPDFDFATKQLADVRDPAGETLARRKAEFLKAVEPQIDRTWLVQDKGKKDVAGGMRLYDFHVMLDQQIEDARKAGKSPFGLLTPGNPDYLGTPEALKPYKRTFQQMMDDMNVAQFGATGREEAPPDISTPDKLKAAYQARTISREAAENEALKRNWISEMPLDLAPSEELIAEFQAGTKSLEDLAPPAPSDYDTPEKLIAAYQAGRIGSEYATAKAIEQHWILSLPALAAPPAR